MGNLVSKTDTYSKAEADAGFLPKGASYLKPESDAKYQPIGDYAINGASYLKAESDAKFQPVGKYATVDAAGKLSLPVNYYTASDVDTKLSTLASSNAIADVKTKMMWCADGGICDAPGKVLQLRVGNTTVFHRLSGDDDGWLRHLNENNQHAGRGFASGKLWANEGANVLGTLNVGADNTAEHWGLRGFNMKRADGKWTHLDWKDDGKNYIRGDTIVDGNTSLNGAVNVTSKRLQIGNWFIEEAPNGNLHIHKGDINDWYAAVDGGKMLYGRNALRTGPTGWMITEDGQHLVFKINNAVQGSDNQAHLRMTQDGNLWLSRSSGPGWVADSLQKLGFKP